MIEKTLFGIVRRSADYRKEFALKDELCLEAEPARAKARMIKKSVDPYDKANPVVRVAKFELREMEVMS